MAVRMTVDDILPLIALLTPDERAELVCLLTQPSTSNDASKYEVCPPGMHEFGADEDPLAWEGDDWSAFG